MNVINSFNLIYKIFNINCLMKTTFYLILQLHLLLFNDLNLFILLINYLKIIVLNIIDVKIIILNIYNMKMKS